MFPRLACSADHKPLAAGYTCQAQNDVKLVFACHAEPGAELWAPSKLLQAVSPYYRDMLDSGMQESLVVVIEPGAGSAKRKAPEPAAPGDAAAAADGSADPPEDDSDTEADDIYRRAAEDSTSAKPVATQPGLKHKRVVVTHAKYATYVALLSWLQTGRIVFAPLKSSFATSSTRIEPLRHALACKPHAPIPVSAKAVYKLAHYLDIPSLATISLDTYLSQIDVRHAAQEVFGSMLGFPEAKARLVNFMEDNRHAFKEAGGLAEVKDRLNRNEFEGLEKEVMEVLIGLA